MGRAYWFECSKCGYRAKVSGRAERGSHFHAQTVKCDQCRSLYEVVTRLRVPDFSPVAHWRNPLTLYRRHRTVPQRLFSGPPPFEEVVNRLPYHGFNRFRWLNYKLTCPVSAIHHVEPWNDPGKCPRCGIFMERGATPFVIWE